MHKLQRLLVTLSVVVAAAVILPVSASAYLAYRNASLVSTSVPKTMVAGSTYKVTFKMKNTGRYTWTYVSDYKLRARGGSDPFTRVLSYRVAKKDRITTGHSKTFTITMKAPSKPGVYTTDWRMHRGTLEFGPVVSRKVTVVAPALTGITLTKAPTKVHYLTGEALDLTGLVVTGTYNNGTTAVVPVTAANITGFSSDAVAAAQTVTITVGGKTATFVIDVADAGTFHVSTLEQLKAALGNTAAETIVFAADISTPEKLVVSRPVVIDGAGKSLTMTGDAAGWQGNYVLQVYNTTGVTISGIKITGGDAALLVNGSEVVLTGAIDVSGNEFGGMESSKGVGLTRMPKLDVTNATLVNSSEAYGKPTIWEDGADITGTVLGASGMAKTTLVRAGQTQYYLDGEITVSTAAGLTAALADSAFTKITLAADISTPEKLVVSRPVVIDGAGKSLTMTGDAAGWQGNYVLQVYNTTGVTISGIKITGGDAALLVNGSEVVLTGAIDVSGNEFGGMESSKGVGLTRMPKLDVTNATLTNTTQALGLPTIWEDGVTDTVTGAGSMQSSTTVKAGQVQYYLIP